MNIAICCVIFGILDFTVAPGSTAIVRIVSGTTSVSIRDICNVSIDSTQKIYK